MRPVGKRSSGTTRRSGSVVGRVAPARVVLLYRSPRPRTKTDCPSTTETPVTRCMASAAFESSLADISMAPMLSCTDGARIRIIICAAAVDESASRVGAVTTSSSANTFEPSATWTGDDRPATTSTVTFVSA